MTARFFCSTNLCTLQAAQLHHAAQREAALRAQLAAVTAERDALAARVTEQAARLAEAEAGKAFYEGLFCDAARAANMPQNGAKTGAGGAR